MKNKHLIAKPVLYPAALAIRYQRYILNTIKKTKQKIRSSLSNSSSFVIRKDDYVDEVDQIIAQIKTELDAERAFLLRDLTNEANRIIAYTYRQILNSLSSIITIKRPDFFGVDLFKSVFNNDLPLLVKSWVSTNARLIQSLNENLLNDVANIIESGFRAGESVATIKSELVKKFNISLENPLQRLKAN